MKKTNFTFVRILKNSLSESGFRNVMTFGFVLLALIIINPKADAQCSMACNSFVQVSLDQICQATITPAMMLNDTATACPNANYEVEVLKYNKKIPTSPIVNGDHLNLKLTVKVKDKNSGNSCWGEILIEDKLPPILTCGIDTTECYLASSYLPTITENCYIDTLILINEIPHTLNCDPTFIKRISRQYIAKDKAGNVSAPCWIDIYLNRFPIDSVVCPDPEPFIIECKDIKNKRIDLDSKGNPQPYEVGVPHVKTSTGTLLPLWPPTDIYCNIGVTYNDIRLPKIKCTEKIMRTWTIREWWCGREIDTICIQFIEITDTEAPIITCPHVSHFTTDGGYKCEATVVLPPAIVYDSCSGNNVRVDVVYPGGFLKNQNGGTVKLPVGNNHRIVYRAYDECHNVDSCIIYIDVLDKSAPVAICDRETVVSLGYDGKTHVYARTFDDGSYDDCHIDSMLVRRMNESPCDNDNLQEVFKPYVEFCCVDVGQRIMIVFRVRDAHHNFNDCMVEVEVQDKIAPTVVCPEHVTIPCEYHFDINNMGAVFGRVVDDEATRQKYHIKYSAHGQDFDYVLKDGYAHDNCNYTIRPTFVDNRNQCNVGTIVRTWEVSDSNGKSTCSQVITINNYNPYNLDNVIFPRDTTFTGCFTNTDFHPDRTGYPKFPGENRCDLIGQTYEDHTFRFVRGSDACYKIVRKWKVLDWCQEMRDVKTNTLLGYYTREYSQTIKVNNTDDPIITGMFRDTSFCSFDSSCVNGFAPLIATARDSCTPTGELANEYLVDLGNNGTIDTTVFGNGGTINASGIYPLGTHKIKFVFEDRCGNKSTRERIFTIRNCKPPSPYCLNGLATDLMPMDLNQDGVIDTAMVTIWAKDFDRGSGQVCGNPITFSFSSDTNFKSRTFTCRDTGQQNVQMWVTDVVTGAQNFCNTYIIIQDNNNACRRRRTATGTISGLIRSEEGLGLLQAQVKFENVQMAPSETDNLGSYTFTSMPFGGNYTLKANKNNDPLNGVTTADIVRIQRMILGLEELDSPYKRIAADANKDGKISASDISEIRALILGKISQFKYNDSWRFVDAAYAFNSDEPEAESFPEQYVFKPFDNDMMTVNFTAVKVGDVNGNAKTNVGAIAGSRNRNTLTLITHESAYKAGEEVVVPIRVKDLVSLRGYQFTLAFDKLKLVFENIQAGSCLVNAENIGTTKVKDGMVSLSWNSTIQLNLNADDILFTAKFKALSTGLVSHAIQINSALTVAEAYNQHDEELSIQFGIRTNNGFVDNAKFVLYQNQPNPFSDLTTINFELPQDGKAQLTIYDVDGRIVFKSEYQGVKGLNSVAVGYEELGVSGVLYYQLDAAGSTDTKRMVILK